MPSRETAARSPDTRRKTSSFLLISGLCFAAYMANCRTLPLQMAGDTIPNRLIPFSILRFGTTTLEPFRQEFDAAGPRTWTVPDQHGTLVSLVPLGTPIAVVPFYVPVYVFLSAGGLPSARLLMVISEIAEKYVAAAVAALTIGIFYLTARRRVNERQAFWTALAFGLATSMWATASQMLWQHTVVAASVTAALWLLTWPGLPRAAVAAAGAMLSIALSSRPTAAVFFFAGLASVLAMAEGRRLSHAFWYCLAAAPLLVFVGATNYYYWDRSVLGSFGVVYGPMAPDLLRADRLTGIAGLLVSPNRGLFIFTPIALIGVIGLARQFVSRERRDLVLLSFSVASVAHLYIAGTYHEWWGGWSFGPRYLVDILPVLAVAAATVWPRLPSWSRKLALIALVWSCLVQIDGAFFYPASRWNPRVLSVHKADAPWLWSEFELWQDYRAWSQQSEPWSAPWR